MTKRSEVRFNLTGLENIKRAVGDTYRARVGVLGANVQRTGDDSTLTNAEIIVIQMFGSLSRNIPPRDPLYAPLLRHRRELLQEIGKGKMKAAFESGRYEDMFKLLGITAEGIVQQAFETSGDGTWAANAPSTIRAKGSSQPLIDHGQLRRAISSDVVKKGEASKGGVVMAPPT